MLSGASEGRVLVGGSARGEALVLAEPLSFWGGLDPQDGRISDRRHPQHGECLSGRILVMSSGRGSSSSSTVLAEAIRLGTGPAAILLAETDAIVVTGALVAADLYGTRVAVVQLGAAAFAALRTGDRLAVHESGRIEHTAG